MLKTRLIKLKKRNKNKFVVLMFCCIVIASIYFVTKIYLNTKPDILFVVLGYTSNQSEVHRYAKNMIYKKIAKSDYEQLLVERLKNNKKENMHRHYIHVLGVAGIEEIITYLKTKIDDNMQQTDMYIISVSIQSLGAIGNKDAIPFLEKILGTFPKSWQNRTIAYSLYLLTGKEYEFKVSPGSISTEKYNASYWDREAKKLINQLDDKERLYEDMVRLDRLMYPTTKERMNRINQLYRNM